MISFRIAVVVFLALAVGAFVCSYLDLQALSFVSTLVTYASYQRYYALSTHLYARAMAMAATDTTGYVHRVAV